MDLLVRDRRGLALVEVKSGRIGPRFRPGHRLEREQLERLHRAAAWLRRRSGIPARVELFEVLFDSEGRFLQCIDHDELTHSPPPLPGIR